MLFRLAVRGKRGSLVSIPDCMCIGSCPKAAHGRGILLSYMQLVFIANFESFLPYYMSRHFPLPPSDGSPTSYLTSTHPISGMRVQDFEPTKSANRQSARPFSLGSTTMWASGRLIAATQPISELEPTRLSGTWCLHVPYYMYSFLDWRCSRKRNYPK